MTYTYRKPVCNSTHEPTHERKKVEREREIFDPLSWQTENWTQHVPGHATFNVSPKARIPRHEARFRVCTRPLMEPPLPQQITPCRLSSTQQDEKRNKTDLALDGDISTSYSSFRHARTSIYARILSDMLKKRSDALYKTYKLH